MPFLAELWSSDGNGRLVVWSGLCSQQSNFRSQLRGFSAAFVAIEDEEEKP